MAFQHPRSVPAIMTDLVTHLADLVRNEGRLARAEISEKLSQIGSGLTMIIIGAVLLMPALVVLLEAVVAALERGGIQTPWAAVIAGGVTLLLGFILLMIGGNRLKNLLPNRTIHQIQQDASVVKHQVSDDEDFQRAA